MPTRIATKLEAEAGGARCFTSGGTRTRNFKNEDDKGDSVGDYMGIVQQKSLQLRSQALPAH